jgi:Xaa-Pro aminopeptidase
MKQIVQPVQIIILILCYIFCLNVNAEVLSLKASDKNLTADLKDRREKVFDLMEKDSLLVLLPAERKNRSNDVDWAYRQNNDLYYLTGSTYPDNYLVMLKEGNKRYEYFFYKESNPQYVQWMGILPSAEQSKLDTGIENVYSHKKFDLFMNTLLNGRHFNPGERNRDESPPKHLDFFSKLIQGQTTMWLSLGQRRQIDNSKASVESEFADNISKKFPEIKIQNFSSQLANLREVKTQYELTVLQKAIDITIEAQKKAMHRVQSAEWEYQVQAIIDYTFRDQGACCPSFPSIAASGSNATILHYEHPVAKIEKDKLFLTDIGAEYQYYAADVTRTYPADGTFSEIQKDIYSAVLKAQKVGINKVTQGALNKDIEAAITDSIGDDLLALGLIDKKDKKQIYTYYAHGFGHSLGMDVHDTFKYYQKLKKNMIITVEPGIYVRKSKVIASPFYKALNGEKKDRIDAALEKYDGIGVRIEDDILVTKRGPKVLSKNAPREIAEIEAWMAKAK